MMAMKLAKLFGIAFAVALAGAASQADAQWNNEPIQFGSGGRGEIGMSFGYRQMIIDNEITGIEPDNLVRNSAGILLDVVEGPGNLAIVRNQASGVAPMGAAGFSIDGGSVGLAYGVGGSFDGGDGGGIALGGVYDNASVIAGWVALAAPESGGAFVPAGGSPIDMWVAQVASMPKLAAPRMDALP
jgi:hypothetical protein